MKKLLTNVKGKKIDLIIEIKTRFENGEITLEQAQNEMLERVGEISASEIAFVEQKLKVLDDDHCQKESIQQMVAIFDKVRKRTKFDLPKDHPIKSYVLENQVAKDTIAILDEYIKEGNFDKDKWEIEYQKLLNHKIHYKRKQNQLYSELEKRDFDRPSKVMWTLDDFIRDEINDGYEMLKNGEFEKLKNHQEILNNDMLDLMSKEEEILYPTSLDLINEDEFREMRSGDDEVGYANIEHPTEFLPIKVEKEEEPTNTSDFGSELANLLAKHGYGNEKKSEELKVAEGLLTLEQINLIFKHLPVDFSYVDENNKVRFYSDTKHRVFPRSKSAIGRDVRNCHPQKSVHIVEEIINKFRSGEQDRAEFWINKEGVFIYIIYIAIRDEKGNYRGVLEMMQDALNIRNLEGSQTLLNWEKDNSVEKREEETKVSDTTKFEINEMTRLQDILQKNPKIKAKLIEYNPAFSMLKTPLARIMIPKANVKMMSERSGVEIDELIAKLKEWINE